MLPFLQGMSFLTATNTELIYNMTAAGSDDTTTTPFLVTANTSTNPGAYLPPLASIWQPSTLVGKGFSIRLGGTFDQAAANTNKFQYGLNTTQGSTSFASGVVLAATGTPSWTNTTTGIWHAQIDITVTSIGENAGLIANCYVDGFITYGVAGGAVTSTVQALASAANTTPTTVAVTATQAYWFEAVFTWGTAPVHSACQKHMIFGLN